MNARGPPQPRAHSPPQGHYRHPHPMDHRASTGSLPQMDSYYGHQPPPHTYSQPPSPGESADDNFYNGPPHHPPVQPHYGPPPMAMYPPPPHPLMRPGMPGQPHPMHMRGAGPDDYRRDLGGIPRELPGPGGGHRSTESSGAPRPILRRPAAPVAPDLPPSPEYPRHPQPGPSTREASPDDFPERQYMHGGPPGGGYPYRYTEPERYPQEQRGRPGDQSPYDDYDGSYGAGPRARSTSRPPRRSRSVGPAPRSHSRPPERVPQSATALVRREQGRDWGDSEYGDDYDDEYFHNRSGAGGRSMSRNGSDEMSGGSGPSHGPGHRSTRGEGIVAGGAPRPATNIRLNIGREAAVDISYSGSSGGPQRVHRWGNAPPQGPPLSQSSGPAHPALGQSTTPAPAHTYLPPPSKSPAPPPQPQHTATAPPPPPQPQPQPLAPIAPVAPVPSPIPQQIIAAAHPQGAPQQMTLDPSAGIVAVIPPGAMNEGDSGVVLDADMEREFMMRQSFMTGMGALSLDTQPSQYYNMPVQLSDKFLYQEGRLREKNERNLSDEEAGGAKLVQTTINEVRDRENERDWDPRDRERSRDRDNRRRRRSLSRPGGTRRRAGSAGPVEGKKPKWTRISREILSQRAVEEMGYLFEPLEDSITIFKVLSRNDIDKLVELSIKIRKGRDRDRDRDRDRGDRNGRDRDRDRDRRDRRHRDSWQGKPPQGHMEMPMPMPGVPHPGMMAARAPAPAPAMAPAPAPPAPPQSAPPPPAPAPPAFHAAPMMVGQPKAGGLVENLNMPGTYLQYRRVPPKPAGFYRNPMG